MKRKLAGLMAFALGMMFVALPALSQPPAGKDEKGGKGKGDKKGGTGKAGEAVGGPPNAKEARPFQDLWIPPILEGKSFDLALDKSNKSFWPGATVDTCGFNGSPFWGPTLIFEKGAEVGIDLRNNLAEATTVHWHGLHLPAAMDGGPHQAIAAGATWKPTFTVKNNAGTFWYHPHPHEATQKQMTLGAGGLIIIRDPIEAALALPRTYGVDDLPVVLTSRRFTRDNQFSSDGDNDKYGDFLLTNGTLDARVKLPAQFVRLRILNAEIERGYELGFGDNRTFHLIATDGGLVDKPIALTRMKLMVGERAELLVNLGSDKPGSALDLMAYNAGQAFGFPGSEPDRGRPNGGFLNNLDFRLLRIEVVPPTAKPLVALPATLTKNRFWNDAEVTNRRTVKIGRGPGRGEFAFDGKYFDMHEANAVVKLDAVEAWTVSNDRIFGHSFHIHDVQFNIVSRSDGPVPEYERGWKDSFYVPRGASVTFIAKFDDFASDADPFMYHCHMANHEDAGLMGQFLVSKDPASIKRDSIGLIRIRDRVEHPVSPELIQSSAKQAQTPAPDFRTTDIAGKPIILAALTEKKPLILFFIDCQCPCSADAAPFLDRLQKLYAGECTVVGVTNSDGKIAGAWARQVGVGFPIVADPELAIIGRYAAERSVTTTLVAPGGKIAKTYPGYSAEMLAELSSSIAKLAGVSARSLPVEDAPKKLVSGCPFQLP